MLSIQCIADYIPLPTRCFNSMTNFARPANRVDEGTPHVAPKVRDGVLRGIALVRVHQPQTAADNRVDDGDAGATDVFRVHHLQAHACSERGLHSLCKLRTRTDGKGGKGEKSKRHIDTSVLDRVVAI